MTCEYGNPKATCDKCAILALVAENERSFQALGSNGVPRELARTVANGIDVLVTRMARESQALAAELERERLRLAACGTAALGYFEGCKPEYDSASLRDVLRLAAEVAALRKDAERWRFFVRTASLGFDGAASWNALIRFPVFDSTDGTITRLVDTAMGEKS